MALINFPFPFPGYTTLYSYQDNYIDPSNNSFMHMCLPTKISLHQW